MRIPTLDAFGCANLRKRVLLVGTLGLRQLDRRHAQRPDVALLTAVAVDQLGRHPGVGAADLLPRGEGVNRLGGQSEVPQLHNALLRKEDVRSLDVLVENSRYNPVRGG